MYTSRLSFFGDPTTATAFNPNDPQSFGVSPPTLVVEIGDELFNDSNGNGIRDSFEPLLAAGTVADISINDPINNRDRGDVAFVANMSDGSEVVVRGRSQEVVFIDFSPQFSFASALSPQGQIIFSQNLGVPSPGFVGDIGQVFSILAPTRAELNGTANISAIQQNIADKVQQAFDTINVNVRVVTSQPLSNDFMHVFVGDGGGLGPANQGLNGIASAIDLFNQDLFDFTNPMTGVISFQPCRILRQYSSITFLGQQTQ